MTGLIFIHWTIRLALAAFLACLLGWTLRAKWANGALGRTVWTLGLVAFLLHLLSAFAFYHRWSPEHALVHTAEETEKMMGFRFGEGIYFSYFFAVLWAADAAWWWISPASYERRPRWLGGMIVGYLIFIAFNGAVVFEGGPVRIAGMIGSGLLVILVLRQWLFIRQPAGDADATSSPETASP